MSGPQIGSAIILGIEEVQRRNILPGYSIEWVWRDSWCNSLRGMRMAVDMWKNAEDLDGIIGDGCSVVCQPLALLAASWGFPVISWGCTSGSLSDKNTYPTFTRVEGTWTILAPVMEAIAKQFNWTHFGIIYSQEDVFRITAEAVMRTLGSNNVSVVPQVIGNVMRGNSVNEKAQLAQQEILKSMKQKARIVVILLYPSELLHLMLNAEIVGMKNGEYAFILLQDTITPSNPIFEGVIGVGTRRPSEPNFDAFLHRVIEAFQDP